MRAAFTLAAVLLAGCAGNVKLLDGQQVYPGRFEAAGKTLEVDIGGEKYAGTYVTNASSGFGTAFSGTKVATFNTFSGGSQGRATLTSPSGKFLVCEFMYQGMAAQGVCQDSTGKQYQLVTN